MFRAMILPLSLLLAALALTGCGSGRDPGGGTMPKPDLA